MFRRHFNVEIEGTIQVRKNYSYDEKGRRFVQKVVMKSH